MGRVYGTPDTKTTYIYSGFRVVEELDDSDALAMEYVHGQMYIDEIILLDDQTTIYYFAHDRTYSTTSLMNTSGSVVESYEYKVYGKRIASGSGLTEMGYTGRRHDDETGLMYFRNRYYSVDRGSFVTRDAKGYVDGYSMYLGYFGGNGVDPSGYEEYFKREIDSVFKEIEELKRSKINGSSMFASLHHNKHSVVLKYKCASSEKKNEILNRLFLNLSSFEHFNGNNNNTAKATVGKDSVTFSTLDRVAKTMSLVAFNADPFKVNLSSNKALFEVTAVTTGAHPLSGVRKWRVIVLESNNSILKVKIETEAYEMKRTFLSSIPVFIDSIFDLGAPDRLVPDKIANNLWISYLENIALAEKSNGAKVDQKPKSEVDEYLKSSENPWMKGELKKLKDEQDKKLDGLVKEINEWRRIDDYKNNLMRSGRNPEEVNVMVDERIAQKGLSHR